MKDTRLKINRQLTEWENICIISEASKNYMLFNPIHINILKFTQNLYKSTEKKIAMPIKKWTKNMNTQCKEKISKCNSI